MSGPVSPTMTQYKVARRSTGNQEQQMVNDKRSDEDEDEDEEEEEVEEEEDGTVPHDPVKKDFDEILDKIKKGELKSGKDERKKFFHRYEKHIYAQTVEEKTLLHELAYYERPFTSVKPLIVHLTRTDPKKYSELLLTTDDSAKNPLFVAIMKRNNKNNKLVELMCKNSDISLASFQKTLAMSCGERSENCLHAAIKYKLPFKMTIDLITRAAKNTFYAQDSNGFTPCHYAVEYERCTKPQIDIVKALIQYGDLALDQLSEKPCFFSVYQYHIHTRQGYLSGKKGQGLSPAQNPTDSVQLIRDYGQNVPHGSSAKPVKSPKESDLKRPPKDGHRGNFQGTKDDRNQMIHSSALSPIEDPREAHDETKSPLEAIIEPPATSSSGMSNPIVSNDNAKKKEKCNGEFEGLKEDAEEIRDLLQLHYLRTRTSEVAVSRLYGETSKGKLLNC